MAETPFHEERRQNFLRLLGTTWAPSLSPFPVVSIRRTCAQVWLPALLSVCLLASSFPGEETVGLAREWVGIPTPPPGEGEIRHTMLRPAFLLYKEQRGPPGRTRRAFREKTEAASFRVGLDVRAAACFRKHALPPGLPRVTRGHLPRLGSSSWERRGRG